MGEAVLATALARHYRRGHATVAALDGVDIALARGSFLGIVGRSGSGKTTLLNLVGGLDRPTSGSLLVDGIEIRSLDDDQLASFRRDRVGFIFQEFNLLPTLSAAENVALPLAFRGIGAAERRRQAHELLSRVGLSDRTSHKPSELSGGEAQRVAIARALISRPAVLLADEPTGNLDSKTSEEILALLRHLNEADGATVLLVTHDRGLAETAASRVIELHDGKVASDSASKGPS